MRGQRRQDNEGRPVPSLLTLLVPVTGLGVAALAAALWELTAHTPSLGVLAAIAVLAAASTLAEASPVPMESVPGGSVSLAAVFVVGGGMLYGWEAAVVIAFATRVILEIAGRRPLVRLAYNGAVYAIGGAAAGLASSLVPGDSAVPALISVLLGASGFWLTNVVLVSAVIARWRSEPFFGLLTRSAYWTAVPFAIMASVSLTLKILWEASPAYAFALVGPLVAVGLYQRSTHRALRAMRLALTDPLTGLGNHRHFHEQLQRELDRADGREEPVALCLVDVDDFKRINDRYGHPVGDRMLAQVASQLRQNGESFRLGGDEFALVLPALNEHEALHVAAHVCERLSTVHTDDGETLTVSVGVAVYPAHGRDRSELMRVCDSALYRAKGEGKRCVRLYEPGLAELAQLRRLPESVDRAARLRAAASLARTVDARDAYTGAHSERVGALAARLAARVGMPIEEVELVRLAGLLHDVGKLVVPESLLRKPAALSGPERLVVEQHPQIGSSMLTSLEIEPVANWVLHHHERWDGTGYPHGVSGFAIPLGSRIIFVADAYDAMTTDRVYRPRLSHQAAIGELRRCSGTQFDPDIVEALVDELSLLEPAAVPLAS